MLTKVECTNNLGETLVLTLEDYSNGYLVKDITGLDPVKANLVTSSMANIDGVQYQTSRREARNIVMKLGLQGGYSSVRDLRNTLYKFFMPKSSVHLSFFVEDEPVMHINGRNESFDVPLFTQEPEGTISIMCADPDFYSVEPGLATATTTPYFDDELLVNYEGTVDTGFSFVMTATRDLPAFTIIHRANDDVFSTLDFTSTVKSGERIVISTVAGTKYAVLVHTDGSSESILYGISPYSSWITLSPGPNYIRVSAEGTGIPYTISYMPRFGGL